jgi:hypothetical protein
MGAEQSLTGSAFVEYPLEPRMSPLGQFNVVLGRAIRRSDEGLKLLISVFEHLVGIL